MDEFIALAETLSFTAAAQRCFTTSSSLRRHIAEIEEDLGGRLFGRTPHHVSITPADEVAYQSFKRIRNAYEQTCSEVAMLSHGAHGLIKIASPYYWTEDFTEPLVALFTGTEPSCTVQIMSCQILDGEEALISGRADVFVDQKTDHHDPDIICKPFSTQGFSAVVLADDPLAQRERVAFEDLAGRRFVFLDPKPNGVEDMNRQCADLLASHGIEAGSPCFAQQIDTLGITLRECKGVSLMPYAIRRMDRSYPAFVPIEGQQDAVKMCLYYLADNSNPLLPRFLDAATTFPG